MMSLLRPGRRNQSSRTRKYFVGGRRNGDPVISMKIS